MLRQAWSRFKVFTQRVVAPYVPPASPLFRSSLYIDRCADELVDAFIAVPVTSLFRRGMPPSHDRDWNIQLASLPFAFASVATANIFYSMDRGFTK